MLPVVQTNSSVTTVVAFRTCGDVTEIRTVGINLMKLLTAPVNIAWKVTFSATKLDDAFLMTGSVMETKTVVAEMTLMNWKKSAVCYLFVNRFD